MNIIYKLTSTVILSLGLSCNLFANEDAVDKMSESEVSAKLPEIRFISNLKDEDSFEPLKQQAILANLSQSAPGCPLSLVVSVETPSTSGGDAAAFTSIMLSASTLGVVPVVSNNDVIIRYQIKVNGETLSEYSYSNNFTDTDFFWAMDFGLSDEAKQWVVSTTETFAQDLSTDEKLAELLNEYAYYFSDLIKES
ncbi:hypothetical protein [Catenovulum sediminis]|uniref:hypothetical protein n=1 Tax=Catenovulum sediminis TaxID=1740262 RepID=UPI00117DEE49|nr:hypothetical protein [Catenovulum sediminis]